MKICPEPTQRVLASGSVFLVRHDHGYLSTGDEGMKILVAQLATDIRLAATVKQFVVICFESRKRHLGLWESISYLAA